MAKNERTDIPEKIKRNVRQRCYFGCVNCGNPLIEYHHIEPWHIVNEHAPYNITLLCPTCHGKVEKGLISKQQVMICNDNPYNKNKQYSPKEMLGYHLFEQDDIQRVNIEIANTKFKLEPTSINLSHYMMIPIMIDEIPVLAFSIINGRLNMYLKIFDEDNKVAVEIINNEVITRLDFWDITFIGNTLKVNKKSHDIFLEIDFNIPYSIHIKRGYLLYNDKGFTVYPNYIKTLKNNNVLSNITVVNSLVGIAMGGLPDNMSAGIVIN